MVLCCQKHIFPDITNECPSVELLQPKSLSTSLISPDTITPYHSLSVPIRNQQSDQQSTLRIGCNETTSLSTHGSHPSIHRTCPITSDSTTSPLGIACDFHQSSPLTIAPDNTCYCCFGNQLSKVSKPTCNKSCLCTMLKLNVSQFSSRFCWSFPLSCCCPMKHFHRRRRLPNENLLVLSIIQLLCGFASIILSTVALTKAIFLYRMATGMWTGFLMLIAGTQGLITARRPIICTLIGLFVLCIIVTVAASLLIGVSVAGTIEDGFLNRESSQSKSFQVFKFTYAFQQGSVPSSGHNPTDSSSFHSPRFSNWTDVKPLRMQTIDDDITSTTSNTHLRACQVIIHVLLLLIGILESSVSLSTSVMCCRYINSRSGSHFHSYSRRTNIVSLDSATANQAAAILQSDGVNRFFGSDNVLLAVDTNSLVNQDAHFIPSKGLDHSIIKPYLHHTVTPFLPGPGRSALILTQARTGSMAWTAARAAASVLGGEQAEHTSSVEAPAGLPSRSRLSLSFSKRIRAKFCSARSRRPRLLITSLPTQSSRSRRSTRRQNSPLDQLDSSAYPPGSTLLYVIPSPSRDDPPMIFPPFPPTYSSLQRRPTHAPSNRSRQRHINSRGTESVRLRNTNATRTFRSHFLSRIHPRNSPRRLFPFTRRDCTTNTRTANPLPSNSSLICAIDRLLQPVLIVEDPKAFIQVERGLHPNPPEYSALDHDSRMCTSSTS